MEFYIRDMKRKFAEEILNWKYEKPYDFYNNELNDASLQELLENSYHVVVNSQEEVVGFFCIGKSAQVPIGSRFGAYAEDYIDIGIGMKPELTGKGNGTQFFEFILKNIEMTSNNVPLRLTVAAFNKRAIRLYEKLGFEKRMEFNNGTTKFITMILMSF